VAREQDVLRSARNVGSGTVLAGSIEQAAICQGYKLLALTLIKDACKETDCRRISPTALCRSRGRSSCRMCRARALAWLEDDAGDYAEGCGISDEAWFLRLERARDAVAAMAEEVTT